MRRTKSLSNLKSQTQQMLDFAVLVTIAAPHLSIELHKKIMTPEIQISEGNVFKPSRDPYSTAKRAIRSYEGVMGATLFTSAFAYFESYFFAAIKEVIDFHGGNIEFQKLIRGHLSTRPSSDIDIELNSLREKYKPRRNDRYRNASRNLRDKKVIWPSSRFMLFGFTEVVRQSKKWKAHEVLTLAIDLLNVDIDDGERSRFNQLREDRNDIAHGRKLDYDLPKAIDASQFFRGLADKIDRVVVSDFMIVECFAQ